MAAAMERITKKEFIEYLDKKFEDNDYIGYIFTCVENADANEQEIKQFLSLYRPVKNI